MQFEMGSRATAIRDKAQAFFEQKILPRNRDWHAHMRRAGEAPEWIAELRREAQAQGLWNLGVADLTEDQPGTRLSNLEFAPIAEIMGRLVWASEVFNCHAPDLPNMITLNHKATPEQKTRWLQPLLEGRMRSAFALTEPEVASSDARNAALRIDRSGNDYVLNGRKWFASGAAHPNCAFVIVIGLTGESGKRNAHTAIIVPADSPGLKVVRELSFLGFRERSAPIGELQFDDVRLPAEALLGEEGEGFRVAQTRLGPARVHHCMRSIGLAEVMMELMMARAAERKTFGRMLAEYDTVQSWVARSRVELEQARLIVLKAAWLLDERGHEQAWREVSIAKIAVPNTVQAIADRAIQLFGAMGGASDSPFHDIFAWARAMRIFDGPDEVHLRQIFRAEQQPQWTIGNSPYMLFDGPPGAA